MNKLSNLLPLIQNENMKIYRRPRTWVMIGIIVAINLLMAFAFYSVTGRPNNYAEFMAEGNAFASIFAMVFSVVIAAEIVAAEFTWGTVKLLLIRPVNRWKVLLSKYIAALLFILCMVAVLFFSSLLFGLLFFGAGSGQVTLATILADYGFEFISLVMTVTFAFMISAVFRSGTLAMSLSFVFLFFGMTINQILIALKYTWAKYLLFINMDLSFYFRGDYRNPYMPEATFGFSVAVLAVYFVVFHLISFYVFSKRDVTA